MPAQLRALLVGPQHRRHRVPPVQRADARARSPGHPGARGCLSTGMVFTYGVFAENGTGTACRRASSCSSLEQERRPLRPRRTPPRSRGPPATPGSRSGVLVLGHREARSSGCRSCRSGLGGGSGPRCAVGITTDQRSDGPSWRWSPTCDRLGRRRPRGDPPRRGPGSGCSASAGGSSSSIMVASSNGSSAASTRLACSLVELADPLADQQRGDRVAREVGQRAGLGHEPVDADDQADPVDQVRPVRCRPAGQRSPGPRR